MTSSRAFSKLALILTVNLFIQFHTAYAGTIPSVQSVQNDVKNFLSTVCSNADSDPGVICDKTIDFFATKIKNEISLGSKQFCNSSSANIMSLFSTSKIESWALKWVIENTLGSLNGTCQKSTNEITSSLIDSVRKPLKKTCADRSEEFLPKDKKGNKPKLCAGVSSSAKDVCSNIVNAGCEAVGTVQPIWGPAVVPACKENLAKVVCGDWLTAIESVAGKEMNKVEPSTTTAKPIKSSSTTFPWKELLLLYFKGA